MGSRSLNKVMIIGNVGGEPRVASTRKTEIVASEMIAFNKRKDARTSPPDETGKNFIDSAEN